MTLSDAWERGPSLIEKVIRLNPFYGNYVHYALWVNCLRQKNYTEAYHETLKLNRPALFWDHLARASTYGLLGNIEDGRKSAAELL
jgi:adenylate cyclase